MLDNHNIIITGDLNFHLDNPAELDVRRFSETLADRGMTQLVKFPTHRGGHILDVVIVRETGSIISALPTVYDPRLSSRRIYPVTTWLYDLQCMQVCLLGSVNSSHFDDCVKLRFGFRARHCLINGPELRWFCH